MPMSILGKPRIPKRKGFSLLEILIALFLVSFVTLAVLSGGGIVGRNELEEVTGDIERSYRFAIDEAVLRNRVVRLRFFLDRSPQEYSIEYGDDANFVVPSTVFAQSEVQGVIEAEEAQKSQEEVDRGFHRISDLSEGNKEILESIHVVGIGSSLGKVFLVEGEASLYIYPDGEKDAAFIAVGDERDIDIITTDAFTDDIQIGREPVPVNGGELLKKQTDLAEELFQIWLKQ